MSKRSFKHMGLIAILACLGLLYTTAGPAAAVTVGAGAGTGLEFPTPDLINGDCASPTAGFGMLDSTFVLNHTGTYVNADNTVVYVGPSKVTIEIEDHVAAPQGAAPGGCTTPPNGDPLIPAEIDITSVSITGSTPGGLPPLGGPGSVNCSQTVDTTGSFLRILEVVVFSFDVTCTTLDGNVIGAGGIANDITVTHLIEGTMTPCVVPPFGFPTNPICDTRPGGQEAGSHLETAYEAVEVP